MISARRARYVCARGAVLLLAALVGCAQTVRVEREDWGAITSDATVRVTTLDGTMRTLTSVVVFTDALEGFDELAAEPVRIPLDSVDFLESRGPANPWPVIVAVSVGIAAVAIVAALSRSNERPAPIALPPPSNSCPFVYSFDGSQYVLDSETFAGAITGGLERTDLDNLQHLRPVDGTYRLRMSNERPETQYTDALGLVVVDHPEGSTVFPDRAGRPQVVLAALAATSAQGLRGGDYTAELSRADGRVWTGDPVATADLAVDAELRDGLVLTFPRPASDQALLAVHAQNTELAPMALEMFLGLHGDELVQWYRRVDRDPAARLSIQEWIAREGTLHVSVWVDGAWRLQDVLLDVGPNLPKTQVARVELTGIEGDEVRIRVEGARGLWTLDWAGLGVDAPGEPLASTLAPSLAEDAKGISVLDALSAIDGVRYTAFPGDRVQIEFPAPPEPPPGSTRTVLLRSTGFYHIYTSGSGPSQTELVDRILTEPLFGNRYLLGRLRSVSSPAP